MKKTLLLTVVSVLFTTLGFSQSDKSWSSVSKSEVIKVSKTTQRESFPKEFKLVELNLETFQKTLIGAPNRLVAKNSKAIISLPNTKGEMERYEMFEASNFSPELQAQFPEIRSYVGIGIDDKHAQVRLSSSPSGIQAMIFRVDKKNEFLEPYSADGKVYAVFNSSREKGKYNFKCYTDDQPLVLTAQQKAEAMSALKSSAGQLKTMRLALSCTAEYTTFHGGTVAGALAAMNATMTRVNGVFEKDLAIRLNLITNESAIIYTNPTTDPYSDVQFDAQGNPDVSAWNAELQANLTSTIGEANYDIGHLFGASGGGGNAGCIGCVCVNGQKGSGITSPADDIPQGDNFDIDYVAHEMGHQMGGNHTFTFSAENNAVNVEPGSGSTIMGYAGITGATDIQAHSDDYYVYASINQIQTNMATKTCPTTTNITHGTPVMNAGSDYTIPKGTPFKLTGTGTDAGGNTLSYCWEQNDDATTVSAATSYPAATKTNGPNFRSFDPVSVPYRYFPALSTVLNNQLSTTWEATSTVARTLNFAFTGRDNVAGGGQTGTDFTLITVSGTVGPFDVTSQATDAISWAQGSTQTITWTVNNTTTLAGSANVDILLSTDGGLTFPTVLAANTTNDGSEAIIVPNVTGEICRVMVKPTGNVYYDINTKPFAIGYTVTNTCTTYSNNTALPIPDGIGNNVPGTTVSKTLNVPVTGLITDVNVTLSGTHTYFWDLVVALTHPNGTAQMRLLNRNCNQVSTGFNVLFNDASPAIVCAANLTGTFAPPQVLSVFNGLAANGVWTLSANDNWAGDSGTINNWSVEVCTNTYQLASENFGLENFVLYPNPNNGNFNIKFDSSSNNDIGIEVNDMRGRQVFFNSYQNNGFFNQNIQLNNLQSGIYLVTVKDGNKKEVKKIVIE